jgi:hypothetical protein
MEWWTVNQNWEFNFQRTSIHPATQGVYPATKYRDKNNPRGFLNYLWNRIDDLMLYGKITLASWVGLVTQSPKRIDSSGLHPVSKPD